MCEKSYSTKSPITRHVKIHEGSSSISCSQCEKLFTRLAYLRWHENSHNKEEMIFRMKLYENFYKQYESEYIFQNLLRLSYETLPNGLNNYKFCTFADEAIANLTYNLNFRAQPWNYLLLGIKMALEKKIEYEFNHVMIVVYENGTSKSRHSYTEELDYSSCSATAILNFGATRIVELCGSYKTLMYYRLKSGSLLTKNSRWTHAILPQSDIDKPTISLTFRKLTSTLI